MSHQWQLAVALATLLWPVSLACMQTMHYWAEKPRSISAAVNPMAISVVIGRFVKGRSKIRVWLSNSCPSGAPDAHHVTPIHHKGWTLATHQVPLIDFLFCLPNEIQGSFSATPWASLGWHAVNERSSLAANQILRRHQWQSSEGKVRQMLSWRMKNGPHFINIWDIVTNVVPSYSLYQAPLYEPNC